MMDFLFLFYLYLHPVLPEVLIGVNMSWKFHFGFYNFFFSFLEMSIG